MGVSFDWLAGLVKGKPDLEAQLTAATAGQAARGATIASASGPPAGVSEKEFQAAVEREASVGGGSKFIQ